jgi:hypothetical protein
LGSPDINIPHIYFEEAYTAVSEHGHNSIAHRVVVLKNTQDIDLNNIYIISGFSDEGIVSNDNYVSKRCFAGTHYAEYPDYYVVHILNQMHQGNNAEREIMFRIMYTYEENGITRYFYSDPDIQTYNNLKASGK